MDGCANMALNKYARFNQLHYKRFFSALNKLNAHAKREKKDLPYRNAVEFSNLVVGNINTQKYAGGYAPLNDRYKEWKAKYGKSGKEFWALFNTLIQRIAPFKVTGGWMGGVQVGMKVGGTSWFGKGDKGHMVDVAQYATWLEEGRAGQPARPLFAPSTVEYWKGGFLKQGTQSLHKMKGYWK